MLRGVAGSVALGVASNVQPAVGASAVSPTAPIPSGRGQAFNAGWQFLRSGDEASDAPPSASGGWRDIDLPHDWSIEDLPPGGDDVVGPFAKTAVGGASAGFAVGGQGWYRKRFELVVPNPARVEVLFDGVYMGSEVWLNGRLLAEHRNGYTPFAVDLTQHLSSDGSNELLVRVRNLGFNQRWYSGSGIYRSVWLDVLSDAAHVARWGVSVITREITGKTATLETTAEIIAPGDSTVHSRILDAAGKLLWETTVPAKALVQQQARMDRPKLWSPESPSLYILETELRQDGRVLDRVSTTFGVRILTFDAAQGMTLNGVTIKLRGGCIHQDHGILGSAAFADAEERKISLLKARGFNAVRPSHNLFSSAFLDACDRLGMMVICESFDVWKAPKFSDLDYSRYFESDWKADLDTVVRSARNRPSVIMWSIGNEIPARNTAEGVAMQWKLANRVHQLDPTRPVTAAIHGFPGLEVSARNTSARKGGAGQVDRASTVFLDVIGYNYKLADYEADHSRFPARVFYGSESFPGDVFAIWEMAEMHPWLIGDFVWTAMDYLGEAGIGGSAVVAAGRPGPGPGISPWPWVNAYCGDIDIVGDQKPSSFARDVAWGISPLEMLVRRPVADGQVERTRLWGWHDEMRNWTWPGWEGRPLTVSIYTSADRIDLMLNGRLLERRAIVAADRKHAQFLVPYAPGRLEAVAFRSGNEIGRRTLETAGVAAALRLVPERRDGGAGRDDLSFIAVEVVDHQGRLVPDARPNIEIQVDGAGELLAFGSANPMASDSYRSGRASAWHGRALAVVRGCGLSGRSAVHARGEGLRPAAISIHLRHRIDHS